MSEVINLRRVRKRLERAEAEQNAAARRLQFGRTKAEREKDAALDKMRETALDRHRRVQGDDI